MSKAGGVVAGIMAALGLSGCDDGTIITQLDSTARLAKSRITTAAHGGFPTEVHGAPFPGIEPYQVAEVLKLPAGWPTDIKFRAIEPTPNDYHKPTRLVLVFGGGVPDPAYHCQLTEPLKTAPPSEVGFDVHAVFCSGQDWFATGYMQAPKARGEDATEFRKAMRQLLRTILDQIDQNRD